MELDFLPRAQRMLQGREADDPVVADLLVICQEVASTNPPSAYPSMDRLNGSLRDIFYLRYYRLRQSMRLYFIAGDGLVLVIYIMESKRRTDLTDGDKQTLKNALDEGRRVLAARRAAREAEQEKAKRADHPKNRNQRTHR